MEITREEMLEAVKEERVYISTVIPWYVSFTIYMLIGVPIL